MDREKVIKGLEMCKIRYCDECPYDDVKNCSFYLDHDALELIKEQRETIDELISDAKALKLLKEQGSQKFFVDESGKITPLPVVVRCKDCKFGSPINERGLDFIFCHFRENKHQYATHGGCFEPDWFCADGERR